MSLLEIYKRFETKDPQRLIFQPREEIVEDLHKGARCDVLVIGGGLHSAVFAHIAALNGLRTVLLEMGDYAQGASGNSGKLLLGPRRSIRPLRCVREGVEWRDLERRAGHLLHPVSLLVAARSTAAGAHDAAAAMVWRAFGRRSAAEAGLVPPGLPFAAHRFGDAHVDDIRLVLEHVLAARQEGARCLNYAAVTSFQMRSKGGLTVGWTDLVTKRQGELAAGIVVNCTGAWAARTGRITPGVLQTLTVFRRTAHFVFRRAWDGPAVAFRPDRGQGFVTLSNFRGRTLVSSAPRDAIGPSRDNVPMPAELEETLAQVSKALPEHGLGISDLQYGYAAVEAYPAAKALGPRYRWVYQEGVLSLIGGAQIDACAIAEEGLARALALGGAKRQRASLRGRKLPGMGLLGDAVGEFSAAAHLAGVPDHVVAAAIRRLGSRVRFLLQIPDGLKGIGGTVLQGEVELACAIDQAESLDDIIYRRLELEPGEGTAPGVLDGILAVLKLHRPSTDEAAERTRYCERLQQSRGGG